MLLMNEQDRETSQPHPRIMRIFEPSDFWQYKEQGQEVLGEITAYLHDFENQLISLISQQKTLGQNYEILCDQIGIAVHPCLRHIQKQESKYPQLRNNEYGQNFLSIVNYKLDAISLTVLTFLLSYFKITSLKLSRNDLTHEADALKNLLQKQASSTYLFLEWNPLESVPNRDEIFLSTVRPGLQHLILRQNKLGNAITKQIMKKIRVTPNMSLKSLDLAGNSLTSGIREDLCQFLREEKHLQTLVISKNQLGDKQFLIDLLDSIGEKEEGQEMALDKPEKAKEEGSNNTSVQNISMAKNGLEDCTASILKNFAAGRGANVQIFLDGNKFTKRVKGSLRKYKSLLI